jgi:Shedu protein SduA, C-terminal
MMEISLVKASIDPFLALKKKLEKQIRSKRSEGVILEAHDKIYEPIKQAIAPVTNAIRHDLIEGTGFGLPFTTRENHRNNIQMLRELLAQNAKERDLQNVLIKSGFLNTDCKMIDEVRMCKSERYHGMRIDLFIHSMKNDGTQKNDGTEIIELKRGTHMLLARAGKPTQELSYGLKRAINQVKGYGNRIIDSDDTAKEHLEERFGIKIEKPELRLVAGRRITSHGGYDLISKVESPNESTGDLQLLIYTWDGMIAEFEMIFD